MVEGNNHNQGNWRDYNPDIAQPRRSIHELSYTNEQLRNMKQKYLMENVINLGYDPAEFGQFMEEKMAGGTNVDNWDMEALMNVCSEYQQ